MDIIMVNNINSPPSNSSRYDWDQLEFGNQIMETSWRMSFSKDISNMIYRRSRDKANGSPREMVMHKMTVDLNMISAIMEYIIVSNLNDTPIVATNSSGSGMNYTHVFK